jgi:uncharacterized hydrophobic protein (TIGR00341 family)
MENQQTESNQNGNTNTESKKESFWFKVTKEDQYITVNELMSETQDQATYFILLVLSSVIIASGLLLANSAILIGGMLITPVLTPVLLVALGMTIGNSDLIKRSLLKILKSLGIIIAIALVLSFIFNVPQDKEFFNAAIFTNTADSAFLYFLVAFASGIAATFAWIRKKVSNMLPGIAIAVSLVPPVAMVGVFIGSGAWDFARFFLMVFMFNIIGIIGGSMVLFSMFKFYNSERLVEKNIEKARQKEAEEAERKRLEEIEKQKQAIKEAEESITIAEEKVKIVEETEEV